MSRPGGRQTFTAAQRATDTTTGRARLDDIEKPVGRGAKLQEISASPEALSNEFRRP